jgi:hypothetical protein
MLAWLKLRTSDDAKPVEPAAYQPAMPTNLCCSERSSVLLFQLAHGQRRCGHEYGRCCSACYHRKGRVCICVFTALNTALGDAGSGLGS